MKYRVVPVIYMLGDIEFDMNATDDVVNDAACVKVERSIKWIESTMATIMRRRG